MINERGYTKAGYLKAGDELVLSNGETVLIDKVEVVEYNESVTVYNFEVEDNHTYYVGEQGLLVHNNCAKTLANNRKIGRYAEALAEADLIAKYGANNVHSQISGKVTNELGETLGRRRLDFIVRNGDELIGVEVKANGAVRSAMQKMKDRLITKGNVTWVGKRAQNAGISATDKVTTVIEMIYKVTLD